MVTSISKNNLLEFNPILVTSTGLVIDGQHRLEAAKELGLPVYYNTIEADLETVILLNNNSKTWSVSDFVDSHIELGLKQYETLKEFKEKWGISYGIAASLLRGKKADDKKHLNDIIRDGSFRVSPFNNSDLVMEWVMAFFDYTDATIRKNRSFINAVVTLIDSELVTLSGLKRKLVIAGKELVRKNTINDYLRQIEDILNYKSRSKIKLY